MKIPMTHAQALQKARKLLGPTAKVIRDTERSSNKIRREASIERAGLRQALKRIDLSAARRAELQASLSQCRKLKKYFRFKVGTITKEFRPFNIFVLVAHADSWEQCFAKIANHNTSRKLPCKSIRIQATKQEDSTMKQHMDLQQARAKAKRLLGAQGYAIRDTAISSNALRKTARTNALSVQETLSADEAQQHTRAALELWLTKQRWLSEYHRFKVGVLDTDLGIQLFTVLAQADSWDTCFEKIITSYKSTSGTCPLGARWVVWHRRSPLIASTGEYFVKNEYSDLRSAQDSDRLRNWIIDAPLSVEWTVGAGDSTQLNACSGVLGRRVHQHASIVINNRSIHIDWAHAEAGAEAPGRARFFHLIRIYVDGALKANAVTGSLLGFDSMAQPALAVISPGLAVSVPSNVTRSNRPPRIWLMKPA